MLLMMGMEATLPKCLLHTAQIQPHIFPITELECRIAMSILVWEKTNLLHASGRGDQSTSLWQVFVESITQYLQGRPAEVGEAVFDKEDDLAVEFVTAAANLRAANYDIPQQSLFITKVLPLCSPHLCLDAPFGIELDHTILIASRSTSNMLECELLGRSCDVMKNLVCRVWLEISSMPLQQQMPL